MDTGGVIGPIIIMLVFDKFDGVSPFYLAITIILVNALLLAMLRKKKEETQTAK